MSDKKKYTKEEIRTFVDEAIRRAKSGEKRELTPEELEHAAGGRRVLKTGEVVTIELIDRYEAMFIDMDLSADALIILNDELGFYPTVPSDLVQATKPKFGDHHWIHYWASKQRNKVRQDESGDDSFLVEYSTG